LDVGDGHEPNSGCDRGCRQAHGVAVRRSTAPKAEAAERSVIHQFSREPDLQDARVLAMIGFRAALLRMSLEVVAIAANVKNLAKDHVPTFSY
jgi:hypothetical protein